MTGWWPDSGDPPPEDWPPEARAQALASAAVHTAEEVVGDALQGEQDRLHRRRIAGTYVLSELLLPALSADTLEELLDQLDDEQRRSLPSLLVRAGWTIGADGRLHPPEGLP